MVDERKCEPKLGVNIELSYDRDFSVRGISRNVPNFIIQTIELYYLVSKVRREINITDSFIDSDY